MSLARLVGNARETSLETIDRAWRYNGYVCVSIDDPMMPWDLREQLTRFMTRKHGFRQGDTSITKRKSRNG